MSTTRCERGDVVLVEVVFTSQRQTKKRPALILSTDIYQADREEVVVAAITSNLGRLRHGDTELEDWEAAGLRLPSVATAIVQTLRRDLITRRLGSLEVADFERVQENLTAALGLRGE